MSGVRTRPEVHGRQAGLSEAGKDPAVVRKLEEAEIEVEFKDTMATAKFRKDQDEFLRKHTAALGLKTTN